MEKYTFPNDPVPNPAAVVAGGRFRFTLINDTVLRYEWSDDGVFEDRPSTFALNRNFPAPEFTVVDTDDQLEIRTDAFHLTYNKDRFDSNGFVVSFCNKNTLWGADWRYGEVPQNLGGTARTLDEVDGRCDLEPGILSRAGYSVLDDSKSMLFEPDGFIAPRRPGDRIDGYLFSYGHDYARAMASFFAISGKQPQLPRWALGNWWSRYYAYTDDQYLALMDRFRAEAIPLSVAVLDMDWHQVKGDHIPHAGWTGYTWNTDLIKHPREFTAALHARRLKITLNDHPHGGVHHHETQYPAMAAALGRDPSTKAPILFDPTNPLFLSAYLNTLHRSLEHDGCDFWWIDWQQGPISRVPGVDPLWLLNHFHYLDSALQSSPRNKNALIFSRYAGPGSHRYPVGFSGDSIATWASLAFQPEFTATAANIGYGWWSHDVGGHFGGARDDELAARWVQLGVFSPVLRLHASCGEFTSKEPWGYGREAGGVMGRWLRWRHRLVPYLFGVNMERGVLVRPLYWRFPGREEAYGRPGEFLFGEGLVVAPVVQRRVASTGRAAVDVWVPPGRHVDVFSGTVYDGEREMRMYRTIEGLPVLAAEGTILPLDGNLAPGNGCVNPEAYELLVVVGQDGEAVIWEDPSDDETPGEGEVRKMVVEFNQARGQLTFPSSRKAWRVQFVSVMAVPASLAVSIDGEAVPNVDPAVQEEGDSPGLDVRIPQAPSGATVVVGLGENPQLSVLDPTPRIRDMLMGFQIDMALKDRVWQVTRAARPTAVKMAQLATLGAAEEVLGPVVELLLADSR